MAMKDTPSVNDVGEAEGALPRYVSFILRCQPRADGGVRTRLLDVRSGFTCSLDDLDELPDLVRQQVFKASGHGRTKDT